MTARSITVQLPPEPAPGSVVLIEMANLAWVDPVKTERLAFQRLDEVHRRACPDQPWRVVGREPVHAAWSWAQLIGLADGRPILVLWEPAEATA